MPIPVRACLQNLINSGCRRYLTRAFPHSQGHYFPLGQRQLSRVKLSSIGESPEVREGLEAAYCIAPVTPKPATFLQDVERAISLTASYVIHFMKSNFQIQLVTSNQKSSFDHGQRHLFALLRTLALLQPTNGNSRQNLTKTIRSLNRTNVIKILISVNTTNGYKQGNFSKIVKVKPME